MSILAIQRYHHDCQKAYEFSGESKEQSIKVFFLKLLNYYCEKRNLFTVSEVSIKNKSGESIRPDGIVKNRSRLNCGYWESKAHCVLEKEIVLKINAGYPLTNTLFQDDQFAILYQNEQFIAKVSLTDYPELDQLLNQFVNYESPEIKEFARAVEQFKEDLSGILENLHTLIALQEKNNPLFISAQKNFLKVCKNSIHHEISLSDVNEMLIQHILTEEIFISIFNDAQFHHENNIAKELYQVEATFFSGTLKRNTLDKIQHYYAIIKSLAAIIDDHHDKQVFLKTIYEDFYKAYNPKKADTLGIVYTPQEIVRFQLESVNHLLEKHFKKTLADKAVKILDPCTGTGTYICELIDYLPKKELPHKYEHDIHANEVALLPYYIANLNIEYTYRQKMATYVKFEHICWTDTLDNTGYLKEINSDLFGLSVENTARIKVQNQQEISVIIGNPPYNANQQNENDNNKNRAYNEIDSRIKNSYVKHSTASNKANLYDMYSRFYRWASDRLNQEQGIVAFITNNSFINKRAFDGFRKCIAEEFDFIYVIDLGGDIRELSGKEGIFLNEEHTIFGKSAAVGIALMFLVKTPKKATSKLYYIHPCDLRATRLEKLEYLYSHPFAEIDFTLIKPDDKNYWLNQTENDFYALLPLIAKEVKEDKSNQALFKLYSLGVNTNRDEWVYDFDSVNLKNKMQFFITEYNKLIKNKDKSFPNTLKWSSSLKTHFENNLKGKFSNAWIQQTLFRPFVKKYHYTEKIFNHRLTKNHYDIFGKHLDQENLVININVSFKELSFLASKIIVDLHFTGDSQCLPFYIYDIEGKRHENITDWGLAQFKNNYVTLVELNKMEIFYYIYAVLHNPGYREKYQLNLKRDFPRIPFYKDFAKWAAWGKQLMALHLDYETVAKYPLKRQDTQVSKIPKVKLKADKLNGRILIDDNTMLSGVPLSAWNYQLGHRSALEWVLDQYKEKKVKDVTIAEKFDSYRFADYKEQVIDLLSRVCNVSIETLRIVELLRVENQTQTDS